MAMNWMTKAALEIYHGGEHGEHRDTSPEVIREVIFRHNPLEEGVAYMPVPRCETCRHWEPYPPNAMSRPVGDCAIVGIYFQDGKIKLGTALDFGCVKWEAK